MAFATKGDAVKVDYIEMLDGKVISTSMKTCAQNAGIYEPNADYNPLAFSIGRGEKSFENALVGMRPGEEKTIVFKQQAAGVHKQEFVRKYPRALFEHAGIALKEGMVLNINTPKGPLRGKVTSLDDNDAVLDLNPEQESGTRAFRIILREIIR